MDILANTLRRQEIWANFSYNDSAGRQCVSLLTVNDQLPARIQEDFLHIKVYEQPNYVNIYHVFVWTANRSTTA